MAFKIFSTDDIASGIRFTTTFDSTDIVVTTGVSVISTDDLALRVNHNAADLLVLGLVRGADGIQLGMSGGANSLNDLTIGSTGTVSANDDALLVYGRSSRILNEGLISAGDVAIVLDVKSLSGQTVLRNTGTILGTDGIVVSVASTQVVDVVNRGLISADDDAYSSLGVTVDRIANRGTIEGDIDLGGSNDRFDNRGGTLFGTVEGGVGDDTFLAGGGEDTFFGGTGSDTLDARGTAGQRISLLDDSGTGIARGDTYVGIENVLGSASGVDILVGSLANNNLWGQGGDDILLGGAGNDGLDGGAGKDRLSGGAGNDSFVYRLPSDGGDIVQGFGATAGNDDRFSVLGLNFGIGPAGDAASLFQSRADNLAQEADDRFIFRTTDKTLWFDSNGNAAGGLTLLADLDTGVVTAADIFLVF